MVKRLPAMRETQVRSLNQEDPLEEGVATHPSTLAWRIPWTGKPSGRQSMGLQRVRHDGASNTPAGDITRALASPADHSLLSREGPGVLTPRPSGTWPHLPAEQQGACVPSLVGELSLCKTHDTVKKQTKRSNSPGKWTVIWSSEHPIVDQHFKWKWSRSVVSDSLPSPWTVASQAPPSMGFSRQEYRSGLPFPSPRDLPNPGIEPGSPTFQADALTSEPPGKPFTKQEKNSTLLPRNKYLVIVYMLLKYQELSSVNMKYNSNSKNSVY